MSFIVSRDTRRRRRFLDHPPLGLQVKASVKNHFSSRPIKIKCGNITRLQHEPPLKNASLICLPFGTGVLVVPFLTH